MKHATRMIKPLTGLFTKTTCGNEVMPSPSASSKFGLNIFNFFKHAQFFMYTQNHFGILKS